jgi:hypothetical protein
MAKSKPIGVRFDLDKLDMIQKEQNLTSVQRVVNYLMDNYQPIKSQKSLIDIIDTTNEPNILAKKSFKLDDSFVKAMEDTKNELNALESLKNGNQEPPSNLKGIDLVIWKSENWK